MASAARQKVRRADANIMADGIKKSVKFKRVDVSFTEEEWRDGLWRVIRSASYPLYRRL